MKFFKARGITFSLTAGEVRNELWADSEDRHEEAGPRAMFFGLLIGLRWGTFIRPFGDWNETTKRVPTLRIPFFVFPWISVAILDKWGFYLGAKDFGFSERYAGPSQIWPDGEVTTPRTRALTFSASFRESRVK